MTTYDCLLKAEAIERLAAEFYARLAQDFAPYPKARELFLHLAEEERQHAVRVALLRNQYRANRRFLTFAPRTGEALEVAHATAEVLLTEVLAGSWGLDLVAVCRRLSAFEEQLGAAHAHVLAEADAAVKRFFLALTKQDRAHRELLDLGGLPGKVIEEWPEQGSRRCRE